jgi:hypothetical protein
LRSSSYRERNEVHISDDLAMADYNAIGVAFVVIGGLLGLAALVILIAGVGPSTEQNNKDRI